MHFRVHREKQNLKYLDTHLLFFLNLKSFLQITFDPTKDYGQLFSDKKFEIDI